MKRKEFHGGSTADFMQKYGTSYGTIKDPNDPKMPDFAMSK